MIRSVEKAFKVIELVTQGHSTLTAIAEASGMPKSTAHRVLANLVEVGVLRQEQHDYRLGVKLIEYGEKAKRGMPVEGAARAPMEELAGATRETVHLGVLDGTDIVYLHKVEGRRGLQMASYVGLRTPAQHTAMGKVLISALPEHRWGEYFQPGEPRTEHSIRTKEEFLEEIRAVRAAGHAFDREENEIGIRCCAAPIRDVHGRAVAAISLTGASVYIGEERLIELVPEVSACADKITRAVGGK